VPSKTAINTVQDIMLMHQKIIKQGCGQYFCSSSQWMYCLQCLDTVCLAPGKHAACKKSSDEVLAWYLSGVRCKWFPYSTADATDTQSSLKIHDG